MDYVNMMTFRYAFCIFFIRRRHGPRLYSKMRFWTAAAAVSVAVAAIAAAAVAIVAATAAAAAVAIAVPAAADSASTPKCGTNANKFLKKKKKIYIRCTKKF